MDLPHRHLTRMAEPLAGINPRREVMENVLFHVERWHSHQGILQGIHGLMLGGHHLGQPRRMLVPNRYGNAYRWAWYEIPDRLIHVPFHCHIFTRPSVSTSTRAYCPCVP